MKWEWVASTQNCVQPSPQTSLEASRTKSPAGFSSPAANAGRSSGLRAPRLKAACLLPPLPSPGGQCFMAGFVLAYRWGSPGFTPGSLELDYSSDQHEAQPIVRRASS